jgi:hypothetical protein
LTPRAAFGVTAMLEARQSRFHGILKWGTRFGKL